MIRVVLAAFFGFWLVGVLLSVQLLIPDPPPPSSSPQPPQPQPSSSSQSTSSPISSLASQTEQLSQLLALKRSKLRRLAIRARIAAEAEADRARTANNTTPLATLTRATDNTDDENGWRRFLAAAHARSERFRELVAVRAAAIRSAAASDRRHAFCLDSVPWCYAPLPPAPPAPPGDGDELKWLELEFAQLNRPLVFGDDDAAVDAPRRRSALFTLTPGRSGTQFFRHLLGAAANVSCFKPETRSTNVPIAAHDPINCTSYFLEPRRATQALRHDVKVGSVLSVLTHFRMPPTLHYCEVNSVTVKAWSDVLVGSALWRDVVDAPINFVVLRRNMARNVKSLVETRWLDSPSDRCSRMAYAAGEPAAFLPRCPDSDSVVDRTIAHLFDVEARTQALVLRAVRLEAARRASATPLAGLSPRALAALRGAGHSRVFEVCLEQLSPEAIADAVRAEGTLADAAIAERAASLARKNAVTLLDDMRYDVRQPVLDQVLSRSWTGDEATLDLFEGGSLDLSPKVRRVSLDMLTPDFIQGRIDAYRARCAAAGIVLPDAPQAAADGCSALKPLPADGTRVRSPRHAPYNKFGAVSATTFRPSTAAPATATPAPSSTTTSAASKAKHTLPSVMPPIAEDWADSEGQSDEDDSFGDDANASLQFFDSSVADNDDAAAHEQQLAALNAVQRRSRRIVPSPTPADAQPPHVRSSSANLAEPPLGAIHQRAAVPALLRATRGNADDVAGALADLHELEQAGAQNRDAFSLRRAFERLDELADVDAQRLRGKQL